MHPLAAVGGWVHEVLTTGGEAGLVALTFVENLFPPIPSELVVPLVGLITAITVALGAAVSALRSGGTAVARGRDG